MMVRREYELVPIVCAEAELQQLAKPFMIIVAVSLEQRPFEELQPVILRRLDQDLGQLEHPLSKVRTDLLDVDVSSVDWVEPVFDQHLNISDTSGEWLSGTPFWHLGWQIVCF